MPLQRGAVRHSCSSARICWTYDMRALTVAFRSESTRENVADVKDYIGSSPPTFSPTNNSPAKVGQQSLEHQPSALHKPSCHPAGMNAPRSVQVGICGQC